MNFLEMKKKAIASFANKIKGFLRNSSSAPPISLDSCADTTAIDYKIYGGYSMNDLPDSYRLLDYIESTGAQYINLGYSLRYNSYNRIVLKIRDIKFPESGVTYIFGTGTSETSNIIALYANYDGTLGFRCTYSGDYTDTIIGSGCDLSDITITIWSDGNIKLEHPGGTETYTYEVKNVTRSTYWYLFWASITNAASTTKSSCKIENFQVYDSNGLLCTNLIPCYRKSDSRIGMWDNARKIFNPNAAGVFVKGNILPNPDSPVDIQFVGEKATKNLFDVDYYMTYNKEQETIRGDTKFSNGFWKNDDGNGFTFKDIPYVENYNDYPLTLKENTQYTLSFEAEWLSTDSRARVDIGFVYDDSTRKTVDIRFSDAKQKYTLTSVADKTVSSIRIYAWQYIGTCKIFNIQLEEGSVATEYEPYGSYKIPVTGHSKNMFNKSELVYGKRTSWGAGYNTKYAILSGNNAYLYIDNIKPFTRYCASVKPGICRISRGIETNNRESQIGYVNQAWYAWVSQDEALTRSSYTFVTSHETTCLLLEINRVDGGVVTSDDIDLSEIMFEEGVTTRTDYEPYHEPTTTNIYLDEPLRKVGDYSDYIDFKNSMVVRNIIEYVSKHNSSIYKKFKNVVRFAYRTESYLPPIKNTYEILSTFLKYVRNGWLDDIESIFHHNNTYYNYYISLYWSRLGLTYDGTNVYRMDDETQTALTNSEICAIEKEYLLSLPEEDRKIYMILKTPTETSMSLPILPTFKGITTVYEVGTTIQPCNMEAEYYSLLKGE